MNQGLHAKFIFNIASLDQYCLTTLTFKLNIKSKSYINYSKVMRPKSIEGCKWCLLQCNK